MIRSLALVLALAPLAACASHEAKATPAPQPQQAPPTDVCVQVFTKARSCTSEFIPALVDSRAKYDQPPGIADAVKKDRNAVIADAMKEWENDSKDEAIAATCQKMGGDVGDRAAAEACLAKTACSEFVACVMPVFEKRFAK
jgi:hypothetical protein